MLESTSKLCSIESEFKVIVESNCKMNIMSLKLSKSDAGKTGGFSMGLNPVKTLLILGGVSQDPTLPKTLSKVLGESYNSLTIVVS